MNAAVKAPSNDTVASVADVASGALLASFSPPPSPLPVDLAALNLPLDAQLLLLNTRYPKSALQSIKILAEKDKPALVKAASSTNMAHRLTRDIMSALSQSGPTAEEEALSRLCVLHFLLDIGISIDDPWDDERHCVSQIVRTWLYPPVEHEEPFSGDHCIGLVACTANLLLAYGASPQSPLSDPTGAASRTDRILQGDEVLGPLIIWERGSFLSGLLNWKAPPTPSSPPRLRL